VLWQTALMPTLTEDLRFRGLIHQVTDEEILSRLDRGGVTAYIGFDPTARSLHVGNLVQLMTLRRLQQAGNRPIVVAGGGTGLIGDPGGRTDERQLLSEAQVASNIAAVREQLGRYLDFDESAGPTQAVLVDNATWLTTLTLTDFLRDVGKHFTVNQMIAKESVRSRLDRADGGISYAEFSYMLLQSYDFYRLHVDYGCDLQLGGSDQWGNITLAIELVKKLTGDQAYGVTTPLLTKPDGTKLGKSTLTDEFVWLDRTMTSPFQLYQYFVTLDDDAVGTSLRMLTFVAHDEIAALESQLAMDPAARAAQRRLAYEVVAFVHSPADADAAMAASEALFDESVSDLDLATLEAVTADAPSTAVGREAITGGVRVVELLVTTGMCASNGEARRAIDQGGVYLNNRRVEDADATVHEADLLHGRYALLRRGKRHPHLVVAG
jgi:tyrosyl-tRNA synthetase